MAKYKSNPKLYMTTGLNNMQLHADRYPMSKVGLNAHKNVYLIPDMGMGYLIECLICSCIIMLRISMNSLHSKHY